MFLVIRNNRIIFELLFCCFMVQACGDSRAASEIEKGRQLYLSHGCAVCHGENGDGQSKFPKKLNPPPIDFHDPKAYRNGTSSEAIAQTITNGAKVSGGGMPSYKHLPNADIQKIATYVRSLANSNTSQDQGIKVIDSWVRWQPPSRPNSAAYMTIENLSAKEMSVVSVTSEMFERVEMHTMQENNGVMSMRPVQEIPVPARGEVQLKPGGLHLMLFGGKKPFEIGEMVSLTLKFQDGSAVDVKALVKRQDEE